MTYRNLALVVLGTLGMSCARQPEHDRDLGILVGYPLAPKNVEVRNCFFSLNTQLTPGTNLFLIDALDGTVATATISGACPTGLEPRQDVTFLRDERRGLAYGVVSTTGKPLPWGLGYASETPPIARRSGSVLEVQFTRDAQALEIFVCHGIDSVHYLLRERVPVARTAWNAVQYLGYELETANCPEGLYEGMGSDTDDARSGPGSFSYWTDWRTGGIAGSAFAVALVAAGALIARRRRTPSRVSASSGSARGFSGLEHSEDLPVDERSATDVPPPAPLLGTSAPGSLASEDDDLSEPGNEELSSLHPSYFKMRVAWALFGLLTLPLSPTAWATAVVLYFSVSGGDLHIAAGVLALGLVWYLATSRVHAAAKFRLPSPPLAPAIGVVSAAILWLSAGYAIFRAWTRT